MRMSLKRSPRGILLLMAQVLCSKTDDVHILCEGKHIISRPIDEGCVPLF